MQHPELNRGRKVCLARTHTQLRVGRGGPTAWQRRSARERRSACQSSNGLGGARDALACTQRAQRSRAHGLSACRRVNPPEARPLPFGFVEGRLRVIPQTLKMQPTSVVMPLALQRPVMAGIIELPENCFCVVVKSQASFWWSKRSSDGMRRSCGLQAALRRSIRPCDGRRRVGGRFAQAMAGGAIAVDSPER